MVSVIKKITFTLFILSTSANAQNRIETNGCVISNSAHTSTANIHVVNNNTKKGTTTDVHGEFKIDCKLNDVLILTSMAFKTVRKIITKIIITEGTLKIKMNSVLNQLNVVNISSHKLTGRLLSDIENIPINFKKNNSFRIDMSDINLESPGTLNESSDYKPPDPLVTSETVNSIDFIKVLKFLTKNIRQKSKAKKTHQDSLIKIPDKIREELGDKFFINELKISKLLINDFIIYCNSQNIYSLYNKNKKIELIEILIKQSNIYLNEIATYKN